MKYVLMFLIPALLLTFGILYVSLDHKAQLTSKSDAVVRPGYETQPAIYNIEASPSYTWGKTHSVVLIVIAYVLLLAPPLYAYFINKKAGVGNWIPVAIAIVLAYLAVFIQYDIKTFAKTVDTSTYEANKDNLDNCFP